MNSWFNKSLRKQLFDQQQGKPQFFKVSKGEILWRVQPTNDCSLKVNKCEDTDKYGVYFSTGKAIALGMILEYKRPMRLCKFEVVKDIEPVYNGKYTFRELEPNRFFKNGRLILNTSPSFSTNHFDNAALPIHPMFDRPEWKEKLNEIEVFLTEKFIDKAYLKNLESKYYSLQDAQAELESMYEKMK